MAENKAAVISKIEHQQLVSIIQLWHATIRRKCNSTEKPDDAWQECCTNVEQLQLYSKAMHQLATQVWEANNSFTRIDWCNKIAMDYFCHGKMKKLLLKERQLCSECNLMLSVTLPVNLLDVGSCYNAFTKYEFNFNVLSLDLYPATKDVKSCDFTKLIITDEEMIDNNDFLLLPETITHLSSGMFSIVVFSLLLEYLPTTRHRWICCEKAYHLLKPEGLLLIITPDSKHQNRNAPMIKSWKMALECIGFVRTNYEKLQHLHCMAFRKRHKCKMCLWKKDCKLESDMVQLDVQTGIYIPQDFNSHSDHEFTENVRCDDEELLQGFLQLPFNV